MDKHNFLEPDDAVQPAKWMRATSCGEVSLWIERGRGQAFALGGVVMKLSDDIFYPKETFVRPLPSEDRQAGKNEGPTPAASSTWPGDEDRLKPKETHEVAYEVSASG